MIIFRKISHTFLLLLLLLSIVVLAGCRGDDAEENQEFDFPVTPDSNQFASFMNTAPGVPKGGAAAGELDNYQDFPEAYYNTIDPGKTRTTFEDWKQANGFPAADGTGGNCVAPGCVTTHVKFRDTKDLGYGRNMFMRWDKTTGEVAVYVENFQVRGVPGLPYGPLNLDALVENDRSWNFGVNAIEFSAFPYTDANAFNFAKFYNFSGDGKLALLTSGNQQHYVDLDNRGLKPMPATCIVCHGGHGRTLIYEDTAGTRKVAPTITGGRAGDVLANMQMLEINTFQFSNAPGFTREENAAGIRLINEAIRSTYQQRDQELAVRRDGDWDPTLAIDIIEGRYNSDFENGTFDENYVPAAWAQNTDSATRNFYSTLIGPNCMVCHALRGSALNPSIAFGSPGILLEYKERLDHLVFERGLMPAGLLNYADFWESGNKNPAELARRIGHSERIGPGDKAIPPGAPVAVIVAPLVATGLNSSTSEIFDIPLSSGGSAFIAQGSQEWSVEPAATATITPAAGGAEAILRTTVDDLYIVTLQATGSETGAIAEAQWTVSVRDQATSTEVPPAGQITFYGPPDASTIRSFLSDKCSFCHSATGEGARDGMPVYYEPCSSSETNGYDFLYRGVLARTNFSDPLSSLILRKPINGATDLLNRGETEISDYHQGGSPLQTDADVSILLSWILNGAPRGDLPAGAPETTVQCL